MSIFFQEKVHEKNIAWQLFKIRESKLKKKKKEPMWQIINRQYKNKENN